MVSDWIFRTIDSEQIIFLRVHQLELHDVPKYGEAVMLDLDPRPEIVREDR
jgi:hypothetical protein